MAILRTFRAFWRALNRPNDPSTWANPPTEKAVRYASAAALKAPAPPWPEEWIEIEDPLDPVRARAWWNGFEEGKAHGHRSGWCNCWQVVLAAFSMVAAGSLLAWHVYEMISTWPIK